MAKTKYAVRKHRTSSSRADITLKRRMNRSTIPVDLRTMTSAELLDVFTAVSAIEKGIPHTPTSSAKVSFMTRRYRYSTADTRKRMMHTISRAIVERNASENPPTPEMIAKIKKTFG